MRFVHTLGIGIVIFFVAFIAATGRLWFIWHIWQKTLQIEPNCAYNLKALWVVARHCSVKGRIPFPPPFKIVRNFIDSGESILITERIANYLGEHSFGQYRDFRGILVCANDPKFLLKMAKMTQGLNYEPSYQWCPDARTLALCPFCRLAILLDGRLEKR